MCWSRRGLGATQAGAPAMGELLGFLASVRRVGIESVRAALGGVGRQALRRWAPAGRGAGGRGSPSLWWGRGESGITQVGGPVTGGAVGSLVPAGRVGIEGVGAVRPPFLWGGVPCWCAFCRGRGDAFLRAGGRCCGTVNIVPCGLIRSRVFSGGGVFSGTARTLRRVGIGSSEAVRSSPPWGGSLRGGLVCWLTARGEASVGAGQWGAWARPQRGFPG